MSRTSLHSAEYERRERRAVGKLNASRSSSSSAKPGQYLSECAMVCYEGNDGLEFNAVRAVVWKDLVLGMGAAEPVPYLSSSIIRKERREQQQQQQQGQETQEGGGPRQASSNADGTDHTTPRRSPPPEPAAASEDNSEPAPLRRRAASQVLCRSQLPSEPSRGAPKISMTTTTTAAAAAAAAGTRAAFSARLPENCQPRVVEADIQRSLWTLYPETTERDAMRQQLKEMLLRVLANNPSRHYYQGLHELMGFVMYVLAPFVPREVTVSVCEGLLRTRWSSFSEERLTGSEALLYAMHAVIAEEDPPLAMALERCGVAPESHYAVSWVLTWYAHSVTDTTVLGRLFDFFIVDEDGLNVVFFTASLVVRERERIVAWIAEANAEASAFEGDSGVITMARVYAQLSKLPTLALAPATVADATALVRKSVAYREQYLPLVVNERDNFLNGVVRKLGYLANQRTRNAALRLLWALLPREWRNPVARRQGVGRMVMLASVALGAALVIMSSREHPEWPSSLFR